MKRFIFIRVILFNLIILFFLNGCYGCKNPQRQQRSSENLSNHLIITVTAIPSVIRPGESSKIFITGSKPDDNSISYRWSASNGSFTNVRVNSVTWISPIKTGCFFIEVVASNDKVLTRKYVNITVTKTPDNLKITNLSLKIFSDEAEELSTKVGSESSYKRKSATINWPSVSNANIVRKRLISDIDSLSGKDDPKRNADSNGSKLFSNKSTNSRLKNLPVCDALRCQFNPGITEDSFGGAIITWEDYRNGSYYNIYAQKVNCLGNNSWTRNGVVICNASYAQASPSIIRDGLGGAIITWEDSRNGHWDIYAQRVDFNGGIRWMKNGVPISRADNSQWNTQIIGDGSGGAIITWEDYRNGNWDIYAQRVNKDGNIQWAENGVEICSSINAQIGPKIIGDGLGGAIITWEDYRNGMNLDIYIQRIDSQGEILWYENGLALCKASEIQASPCISRDGHGGVIVTWEDYRNKSHLDIYSQRVDSYGNTLWTDNGIAICKVYGNQRSPQISTDGSMGAIIVWYDYRNQNRDIYAQRVDLYGNLKWADGIAICTANSDQYYPKIVGDGQGGAIITWKDYRNGYIDIYAQKVDSNGIIKWTNNGVAICVSNRNQDKPRLIGDGQGGAIITWQDSRKGEYDIYVQKIDSMGRDSM